MVVLRKHERKYSSTQEKKKVKFKTKSSHHLMRCKKEVHALLYSPKKGGTNTHIHTKTNPRETEIKVKGINVRLGYNTNNKTKQNATKSQSDPFKVSAIVA